MGFRGSRVQIPPSRFKYRLQPATSYARAGCRRDAIRAAPPLLHAATCDIVGHANSSSTHPHMRKSMAVLTRILLTSAVVAVIAGCSQSGKAPSKTAVAVEARPSVPVEAVNGTNFHLLDFVAWNNHDMDM